MAIRKKPDIEDQDTEAPPLPNPSRKMVSFVVTKFGEGKISTGEHIAGKGDVMAKKGDVLEAPEDGAATLEAQGLVEIVE